MPPTPCPPLSIDDELANMVERYRSAKSAASAAVKKAMEVDKVGHYDKDTPLQARTAGEAETTVAERSAAVALADHLLKWIDKNR